MTVLHHTPRSDPYRPRGGTVIEAKLDIGWSVTGTGDKGKTHSRSDSKRSLNWFKTRFPEDTPQDAMTVERVWDGPESGTVPRYRLVGGEQGVSQTTAAQIREEGVKPLALKLTARASPSPTNTPPTQQERVRAALTRRGAAGAPWATWRKRRASPGSGWTTP